MSNELQEQTLNELQEQNKQYTDAYWDIFNNKEAVPADQQACMREELLKYYKRSVALLDGHEGLEKEREIDELEIKALKINEETKLSKAELEKEYSFKHVKLNERAETKSARVKKEFAILRAAEEETLEIKKAMIVPALEEIPKSFWRWLFRLPARREPNYAYKLASRKAELEAAKYLAAREDEILKLEAEQSSASELELAVIKVMTDYTGGKKRGRKAKTINKALSELIKPLCEMFSRRERALSELIKRLSESSDNAFDEPSEPNPESANIQSEQMRIGELQQTQEKPKRQRIRKTRPESEGEQLYD